MKVPLAIAPHLGPGLARPYPSLSRATKKPLSAMRSFSEPAQNIRQPGLWSPLHPVKMPRLDGPSPCPSPRLTPGRGNPVVGSLRKQEIFWTRPNGPLAQRSEAKRGRVGGASGIRHPSLASVWVTHLAFWVRTSRGWGGLTQFLSHRDHRCMDARPSVVHFASSSPGKMYGNCRFGLALSMH